MPTRLAINGFGRIGREMFRIALTRKDLEVVAINNLSDNKTMAHLLKYDSNYGILDADVKIEDETSITVNGKKIAYFQEKDPSMIPWGTTKADIVLESTGVFTDGEAAKKHLHDGVKKVIITAPGKNVDATFVIGVNESSYDPAKHNVISNASCTTNCMAPLTKVINDTLKIKRGLMTTIHSYTNDQQILDLPHKDPRRARAAALSMIPTSTGAATAVTTVIPELKGKLNGFSVRVPTPTVSLLDCVFEVEKSTTVEELNGILKQAAEGPLKNILAYNELPLVSVDYKGNTHSSIIDGLSTMVMEGTMIKVVAWYDNEWGYSCRAIDLAALMGAKL
ncbi:MAG: type I glyceraldehyde-3-phosphate dehydrogenase [Candidatus Gracilibacteria bacterium]|jgi:glyceraldehyde 3-phosphate dehydrogenase